MPPLTASWADSQRARRPIGPWGLMADSNCRPARYECAALPTEPIKHDRVFYAGHPLSEKPTRIQHRSAATPMDSVLYPLRCFSVSFATVSIHATRVGSDNCYTPRGISIHAAYTGSDYVRRCQVTPRCISIHAPRTGSDAATHNLTRARVYISIQATSKTVIFLSFLPAAWRLPA